MCEIFPRVWRKELHYSPSIEICPLALLLQAQNTGDYANADQILCQVANTTPTYSGTPNNVKSLPLPYPS